MKEDMSKHYLEIINIIIDLRVTVPNYFILREFIWTVWFTPISGPTTVLIFLDKSNPRVTVKNDPVMNLKQKRRKSCLPTPQSPPYADKRSSG